MYKQYQGFNGVRTEAILRISDYAMIPFVKDNTDYQQFRKDLSNGAELQDPTGTVMTASQIQAFMSTLP